MKQLISQIESSHAKDIFLFFEEGRIGEEVKNNLISLSATGVTLDQDDRRLLVKILLETLEKIEASLKIRYPNRNMKLYLWFDQGEDVLRWTVISDVNQEKLPFSSKVHEVTIGKVIDNWFAQKQFYKNELSCSEIESMSSKELRLLISSLEAPSLDVFIHSIPSK